MTNPIRTIAQAIKAARKGELKPVKILNPDKYRNTSGARKWHKS